MHKAIELRDEERTRCEIWTRVMGYHRPVSAFNPGKQSEHAERVCFQESAISSDFAHMGDA
ncbi:MAG: anaerobic ribonucleoside-triphosphate reductase [Candidatus Thiodiazotropha sp. (ex Semelilucina semeliformis)]|nr:anaerobic ribonucleoside-triphosphate reductase [Candidatus Thiodiazotropha sp. (ex Semelilucina semeliformis)]